MFLAAEGVRRALDTGESQQLLIVPAGSSLTLHNLDIRVGTGEVLATRPPHAIAGLPPLWPAIQLEPGAALHLRSVRISLPARDRCVPAAWQQLALKLPIRDAGTGASEQGGSEGGHGARTAWHA